MTDDGGVYVSWCHRCGKENRQPGREVTCNCGVTYSLEWPSHIKIDANGRVVEI